MTELKDCPFCGFHADFADEDVLHISGAWIEEPESDGYKFRHYTHSGDPRKTGYCYVINCVQHYGGCGASISGDSIEEVVAKWNRRVEGK